MSSLFSQVIKLARHISYSFGCLNIINNSELAGSWLAPVRFYLTFFSLFTATLAYHSRTIERSLCNFFFEIRKLVKRTSSLCVSCSFVFVCEAHGKWGKDAQELATYYCSRRTTVVSLSPMNVLLYNSLPIQLNSKKRVEEDADSACGTSSSWSYLFASGASIVMRALQMLAYFMLSRSFFVCFLIEAPSKPIPLLLTMFDWRTLDWSSFFIANPSSPSFVCDSHWISMIIAFCNLKY